MTNPNEKKRQIFATNKYSEKITNTLREWIIELNTYFHRADIDADGKALHASDLIESIHDAMLISYTSGASIKNLETDVEQLVFAYEKQRALQVISFGSPDVLSGFGENDDYECFLQGVGLCILLGRGELIPRLTAIFDRDNKGQDALYEFFASFYDNNRIKTDELFFKRPFAGLLKVIRASSPQEASKLLDKYCKDWYPAFKKAPWHDSHLSIVDDEGSYTGYWAFEAGAVAFLLNIDDSQIDHMVYPKDLVAYARAHTATGATQIPRIEAGQPCTHTGYWFTPAQANSRRHFKQGESMPSFDDSRWGATLWYWVGEEK